MKTELTINIRPIRHVYFISENDLERFVEVANYCCTQWGGINNLIIPVQTNKETEDAQIYVHAYNLFLIRSRQPDVFVDALSDKEENSPIRDALARYFVSEFPGKSLQPWESFILLDDVFHPLNILSPQNDISKPDLAMAGVFPSISPPRSQLDDAIITAAFGRIWTGQERDYEEAFAFKGWDTSFPDSFLYQQTLIDPYASIINLTLGDLHNIGTENGSPSLLFDIVIVQKVWDFCRFWNLRAHSFGHVWLADRRVLLLSKEQLLYEQGAYYEQLVRLLRERRTHKHIESNIDVFFHHNHDQEIHDFLASRSELQRHEGSLHTTMHMGREEDTSDKIYRPIIYEEDKTIGIGVYHEYGGSRPTFSQELTTGIETFLVPSAGPRTGGAGRANVGLQSDFWQQFPAHPSVASLIIPDSSFNRLIDTIELSYPLFLTPRALERISTNIPKTWDIYQAYFRSRGYEVTPSDKKAYADGLLRMAGGLDQEKAHILRSRVAREILEFLTDKATTKLAREMIQRLNLQPALEGDLQQIIANLGAIPQNQRVPKAFGDIFSSIRSVQGLSTVEKKRCLQDLAKLVGIRVVQRGMYIKCPYCATRIWYGIHALDEQIRCNGCLDIFDLPLVASDDDGVERPFQYSLNPLTNQSMDQDVLPVIAALLTLETHHPAMHHVVMGMNFQRVGNNNREGDFDFIYIYKHELYGGECKSGGRFTINDINTAKLAQTLGFRAFFFVAMKTIEAAGQSLIDEYKQELVNNDGNEHPFDIFVLNDQVLFEEAPLPKQIPQ